MQEQEHCHPRRGFSAQEQEQEQERNQEALEMLE